MHIIRVFIPIRVYALHSVKIRVASELAYNDSRTAPANNVSFSRDIFPTSDADRSEFSARSRFAQNSATSFRRSGTKIERKIHQTRIRGHVGYARTTAPGVLNIDLFSTARKPAATRWVSAVTWREPATVSRAATRLSK